MRKYKVVYTIRKLNRENSSPNFFESKLISKKVEFLQLYLVPIILDITVVTSVSSLNANLQNLEVFSSGPYPKMQNWKFFV